VDLLGVDAEGEQARERGEFAADGGVGRALALALGHVGAHVGGGDLAGATGPEDGEEVAQAVLEPLERAPAVRDEEARTGGEPLLLPAPPRGAESDCGLRAGDRTRNRPGRSIQIARQRTPVRRISP